MGNWGQRNISNETAVIDSEWSKIKRTVSRILGEISRRRDASERERQGGERALSVDVARVLVMLLSVNSGSE